MHGGVDASIVRWQVHEQQIATVHGLVLQLVCGWACNVL